MQMRRSDLATVLAVAVVASCEQAGSDDRHPADVEPEIVLEVGVLDDGTATPLWAAGIAVSIGRDSAEALAQERRPLTAEAAAWLEVLRTAIPLVTARAPALAAPFGVTALDATITAGNRGSSDGFGWIPNYIGINLQAFSETYGSPDDGALDRMVRIVAHEYVHLLTYAAYPNHLELRDTPLNRALWTVFHEGLGDYTSVSSRWLPDDQGGYSPVAARTLERLEPIFIERLEALAAANADEERDLRAGISMGRFDDKWGSLPFALWLHSEVARCGEHQTLEAIIRLERDGVLPLALRHAAPELRRRIQALNELVGRTPAGLPTSEQCFLVDVP
jgi:hypothetical protein